MGWVVIATTRPLCRRERGPVPIVQGAEWAPEQVWRRVENLAPYRGSIVGAANL
jgi:hypothetical protein